MSLIHIFYTKLPEIFSAESSSNAKSTRNICPSCVPTATSPLKSKSSSHKYRGTEAGEVKHCNAVILEVRLTHLTIRDENMLKTQTRPSLRPTQRYLPSKFLSLFELLKIRIKLG